MNKKLILAISLMAVAVCGVRVSVVAAVQPVDDHKVTICHSSSEQGLGSVKNPYQQNSVDDDAADGNTGNDNGQGDHSTHTGPVATSEAVAQALKDSKQGWGDIIPPHDNYAGLNWTAEGQAIYNNDCNYVTPVVPPVTGGQGAGDTPAVTTPVTPQVKAPAVAGVNAGGRGSVVPSIAALGGSLSVLGYGVARLRKFNA